MSTLFVYGDSYSDVNDRTRQTNGPLWSENLARAWDIPLKSYAQSGASACTRPDFPSDLTRQLQAAKPAIESAKDQNNIHAVFIGNTDMADGKTTDVEPLVDCVKQHVLELSRLDPNAEILVIGLLPLDFSPYYLAHKKEQSIIKQRTQSYNVGLEDGADSWNAQFVDTYTHFSYVLNDPAEYNMDNVEDAYWETCQGSCLDPVDNYLWWDQVHMTGAGHRALSNELVSKRPVVNEQPIIPPATSSNGAISDQQSSFLEDSAGYDIHLASWVVLCGVCVFILILVRPARLTNMCRSLFRSKKHIKSSAGYSIV
ncbi:hypothetical protein RO3G_03737 [Lichtheimia corymbifera JMRC:FSU:9682]|uniref:Uncharacterized protein n=1 Tax=Lichtheimia corymbifera JMRC:FSU:9682 TaxID=1263082 RepID=A0A068RK54_9FUNG|nr:hypothetical protein RO3G_03737 [Lichtheimia corymbifera JMRC:FSU:9682]